MNYKIAPIIIASIMLSVVMAQSSYNPLTPRLNFPRTISTPQTFSISSPSGLYYINHQISPIQVNISIPSNYQTIPWTSGSTLVQQTECEWIVANQTELVANGTATIVSGSYYSTSFGFTPTVGGKYGIASICLTEHTTWNSSTDVWNPWSSPITSAQQNVTISVISGSGTNPPPPNLTTSLFLQDIANFFTGLINWLKTL
jgi:hypothetical protein